ncbi:VOC family protein [Brachybacterium sp. P6-10-X1]|uniref:VOC family protein n=1 Tax=Brachybacterium sp. P6-10-X1 TaxID=1903186 RepID=UPI00352BA755
MNSHAQPGDVPAGAAGGFPAPTEGLLVTHFLTVRDVAVSLDFYTRVFGAEIVFEENPATIKLANSWIIMNPGGGPTPDKPGIDLRPPPKREIRSPVSSISAWQISRSSTSTLWLKVRAS